MSSETGTRRTSYHLPRPEIASSNGARTTLRRSKSGVLVLDGANAKRTRSFVIELADFGKTHSSLLAVEKLLSASALHAFVGRICRTGLVSTATTTPSQLWKSGAISSGKQSSKKRSFAEMTMTSTVQTEMIHSKSAVETEKTRVVSETCDSSLPRALSFTFGSGQCVHLKWRSAGFRLNKAQFRRIQTALFCQMEFQKWLAQTLFVTLKKEHKCVKTNMAVASMNKLSSKLGHLFDDSSNGKSENSWSNAQKKRFLSEMAEDRMSLLVAQSTRKEFLFNDPFQQMHAGVFEQYIGALFAQFLGAANFMSENSQQKWAKAEAKKKKHVRNWKLLAKLSSCTPDFLVAENCELTVNGCAVRWIECKNYFLHSAKPFISKKIVKQLRKYADAFGNGAIVSSGCLPEFEKEITSKLGGSVLFLDASRLDIPSHYYFK